MQKPLNDLIIYQVGNESIKLKFNPSDETIWATQAQIAKIFDVTPQSITIHLKKIYESRELDENLTCKESLQVQTEGQRWVERNVKTYNLDAILSIGYRVNSRQATDFRRFANSILKNYILQGVAINKQRLKQLNKYLEVISRSEIAEVAGVAEVIKDYVVALYLLKEYDENNLSIPRGNKVTWQLNYDEARMFLDELKANENFGENFAVERTQQFRSIVANLYQTFDGKELYDTVQEKAVNLLYQLVKDHPFIDGNKRSGAALFIYFLAKNGALREFNNNTLAATTLMVALSEPTEKKQIILLIRHFLKA
ncbi:MAG: Fic/DOC family protein [Candidatus Microsaccharimonas sossegonensis]|uniref:Fic/DOC family protein n=1 Tax=Candidatus Microsaccharimonas sossegonensis TaxID=2506948 RepID=A0A4Q0AI15_9BACT|nr:MAG: Fic/DOC family protein [Candidatus Microsaccharimonas sossegonensis]